MKNMSFGDALKELKVGKRVCRAGWVDLDAWIKMETASATVFSANGMGDMEMLPADSTSEFQWIRLSDCGHTSFWVPNQADMLAEDWMLLED